ncbi:MAG: phage protein D, partial [Candidatus Binataceae bacterium]
MNAAEFRQAPGQTPPRLPRKCALPMQVTGTLTMPGTTAVAAGSAITISGFGAYDGKYLIQSARHQLTRMRGYVTEA